MKIFACAFTCRCGKSKSSSVWKNRSAPARSASATEQGQAVDGAGPSSKAYLPNLRRLQTMHRSLPSTKRDKKRAKSGKGQKEGKKCHPPFKSTERQKESGKKAGKKCHPPSKSRTFGKRRTGHVMGDRKQPRRKFRHRNLTLAGSVNPQENFLSQIFGLVFV